MNANSHLTLRLASRFFKVFLFLLAIARNSALSAQVPPPDSAAQEQIIATLNHNAESLRTFKASVEIGLPHPTQPLVQWCHGLLAFQKEGNFLYLKGYHALIPVYFLLKSFEQKFWLYLPRQYTVYWGQNDVLERDPDIDLRLIAGDILEAVSPTRLNAADQIQWQMNGTGYRLILIKQDGNGGTEIDLDQALNIRKLTHFNSAGFRSLDITKNDWRPVGPIQLPYEIIIKRFVPRPNELILRFKDIRPNEALAETLLNHRFPADATYIELIQQE